MGWSRTIIEHISEMRSAARAFYFITRHPMTVVRGYGYSISGQRRVETGTTGAGLKLHIGANQLVSARGAEINSFFVIVPILILVRSPEQIEQFVVACLAGIKRDLYCLGALHIARTHPGHTWRSLNKRLCAATTIHCEIGDVCLATVRLRADCRAQDEDQRTRQ